jgi:hypothetical protein
MDIIICYRLGLRKQECRAQAGDERWRFEKRMRFNGSKFFYYMCGQSGWGFLLIFTLREYQCIMNLGIV